MGDEYRDVTVQGGDSAGDPAGGAGEVRPRAGSGPARQERTGPGRAGLELVLAEVARGDERAFRVLYDSAAPAVLGTVLRVVRDPAQSEEVMQEVLL
jgi:hypothetical protein